MRRFKDCARYALLLLLTTACISACEKKPAPEPVFMGGDTMGTTWSVKITDLPPNIDRAALNSELEAELQAVNNSMSTYIENSELSRFNQSRGGDPFPVSEQLFTVLTEAMRITRISSGAFDVTVGPLVNLWGFGPPRHMDRVPSDADINAARLHVGADKIRLISQSRTVIKLDPEVYVDLSAIAEGYAVDRLADILEQHNVQNYLVDIGGEMSLRGVNNKAQPWTIAVEKPDPNTREAYLLIQPIRATVATSGDYRNYFEKNGVRYSHEIDPATGRPIAHRLASVTVISDRCMTADALATAFMVMGPDKGFALAQAHKLAVLFIVRTDTGFEIIASDAFKPYLQNKPPA